MLYTVMCIIMYGGGACHGQEYCWGFRCRKLIWRMEVCRITDRFSIQQAAAVALFVLLQQILFAQMYGRADCHAFSVCALAGCAWQGNLLWFLIHMLSALTLLAAVQFCRRNVTPDGKLRVPKPFIPYIVVTFWVQIPVMLYLQSKAAYIYA